MQPPSPQPSSPASPKGGYRDAPNPQQPEGRPAPERKGDALFF
jgi:penicillin-binding protein 1A